MTDRQMIVLVITVVVLVAAGLLTMLFSIS